MSLFSVRSTYRLEDAVRDTLAEVETHNAVNTLMAYSSHSKRVLEEFGGHLPLSSISPEMLREYQARRRKELAAPASVNHEMAFISRLFRTAVKRGRASSNPALKVDKLRTNNEREVWLTPEQEAALLGELERLWPDEAETNKDIVRLAILTGMRRMELFGLRRCDVDVERAELCIPRAKSGKRRWVMCNNEAINIVVSLMASHDGEFVIPAMNGATSRRNMANSWYMRRFRIAADAAGLKGVRLHDMRHTFASRLINKGADIYALSELLGHGGVKQTERYAHLCRRRLRDVVDLAD